MEKTRKKLTFHQKLENAIKKNNTLLCVGLDPDLDKIPKHLIAGSDPIFAFNKAIIDATSDLVCSYKPQIAFYASQGLLGLKALIQTVSYIHMAYPHIPVILDAKRGDIGSTAIHYTKEVFDVIRADAVTVNPYLGFDSLQSFLERRDKGIIILCKTSNPSASDFQDAKINKEPLYIKVAKKIIAWNKQYHNCLMVIGATYPKELSAIRTLEPDMFFLVPGIGTQGGNLENTLKFGLTKNKSGLIISSSRAIIFASNGKDFAQMARKKAKKLKNEINKYR
ncbi:MAG: orotidine 5'-phosphate decarboxylase [Candidatus Levybacteria bacterium RIFCSPHIGHO2_02_FULL_42_12]|nr:MAG: orotidine 5'-phosphate decarboxylase [Candidatus Levybacteria bacterium RIFCSPHIGHO2_02_FULL_42_12]